MRKSFERAGKVGGWGKDLLSSSPDLLRAGLGRTLPAY